MERTFFLVSACITKMLTLLNTSKRSLPERILIVKLDHLGDVLTALPAIRMLRHRYPGVHLTLLCGTWAKDIAERLVDVNEVLYYNSSRFCRTRDQEMSGDDIAEVQMKIYENRYDWIIHLRGDYQTLRWVVRLRPKKIVDRGAFMLSQWIRTKILKNPQPSLLEWQINTAMIHTCIPEFTNAVLQRSYIQIEPEDVCTPVSRESEPFPYIVIQPGGTWPYRQWFPDKFAYIIDTLGQHTKLPVVITDVIEQKEYVGDILRQTNYPVRNLTGQIRFIEWYQLIMGAALCIATDGAVVHLASLLNIPVIGLYGPEDPKRWGPWSAQSRVFHVPVECFPCDQTVCVMSDNPCVNLISVDDVAQTAMEILYSAAATRSDKSGVL